MSEDDPSAVRRAHREKRLHSLGASVDGGAVAVGLVVPLSLFAPTLVVEMPEWVVAVGLCVGLFLGGFLARTLAATDTRCHRCHGTYVGVATAIVLGLVILADSLATGETVSLEIRSIAGPGSTRGVLATAIAIGIAGVGGLVASPRGGS